MANFRTQFDWLGSRVDTLTELWPEQPRAMIVGINPAPLSVQVGHYYQGRVGQRRMAQLVNAGLFPAPIEGGYHDEVAFASGVGFADLVPRSTRRETDLEKSELQIRRVELLDKLSGSNTPLIVCVFKAPVEQIFGIKDSVEGFQNNTTHWGAQIFRMPAPFAEKTHAEKVMHTLKVFFAQ